MNRLYTLFTENKKLALYLVALVALGVFALMLGRFAPTPSGAANYDTTPDIVHTQAAPHHDFSQERALEARLEEVFSLVDGAGRVRVMVSPLTGRETVFAVDTNLSESTSTEKDSQGGTRETHSHQSQEQTVMITDRQGTDRPLIVREVEPQIQGIVIIAEGGDSPFVRDALTRAAMAVLGLDAHTIQVLKGNF